MTAKEHNKTLGILLMAHGGFQGLIMLFVGLIYGGVGAALVLGGNKGEEKLIGLIFIAVILFLIVFAALLVVPQVVGGYKLWKEMPNARTWAIVGSVVSCLSFPMGTAVGVYGMWFLFGDMGKQLYAHGGNQMMLDQQSKPPQPNSWQ